MRNIQMPDAVEAITLAAADGGRTDKSERRSSVVARDHCGKDYVVETKRSADVLYLGPVLTVIVRDCDHRIQVRIGITKIDSSAGDRVSAANTHRRIALA